VKALADVKRGFFVAGLATCLQSCRLVSSFLDSRKSRVSHFIGSPSSSVQILLLGGKRVMLIGFSSSLLDGRTLKNCTSLHGR